MRLYLLDTAPVSALLQGRPGAVSLMQPWIVNNEATTSSLVYAEVIEYIKGRNDFDRRRSDLRILLRKIFPYSLTYDILERYADLRRQLRPPYGPGLIGDIDTLIAATALERDLTLVTTDTDYQRVPSLKLMLLPRKKL
jgi:predicted nucleic acid-binding protein